MNNLKYLNHLLLITFLFVACNSQQWEKVDSINKEIVQGDIFKIEPIEDKKVSISGSEFSITKFDFSCTSLKESPGLKYKGTVSFKSGFATRVTSFETLKSQDFEVWPVNTQEMDIEINFPLIPTGQSYSGKGLIYLYITDTDDNCISNIITWKVKFN